MTKQRRTPPTFWARAAAANRRAFRRAITATPSLTLAESAQAIVDAYQNTVGTAIPTCDNCTHPATDHPAFVGQRGWTPRPCTHAGCNCGAFHRDPR